jgi:hypothetical protein
MDLPKTSHPLINADPEDIESIKSAIKEVRQNAIEGLRQAGAVLHVTSDDSKILAVVDAVEAGADENGYPRLIINGDDHSESVDRIVTTVSRKNRMQPVEIMVVFKPKISLIKKKA